jgi:hypothetical protein
LASSDDGPDGKRQLHPLPKGLVELYGLLAVLFVLVPEWMAAGAMRGLDGRRGSGNPLRSHHGLAAFAGAAPGDPEPWRNCGSWRGSDRSGATPRLNRDRLSARILLKRLKRQAGWQSHCDNFNSDGA